MGTKFTAAAVTPAQDTKIPAETAGGSKGYATPASLNANKPAFKATMSANKTDVTDATFTKAPFNTEAFDTGGYYDADTNYRWTPPAGKVALTAAALVSGTFNAGELAFVAIYKNGSLLVNGVPTYSQIANGNRSLASVIDDANGTDYYEAFVYIDTTGADGTISNATSTTYFCGWQL